jgi:hypothetical protein
MEQRFANLPTCLRHRWISPCRPPLWSARYGLECDIEASTKCEIVWTGQCVVAKPRQGKKRFNYAQISRQR